MVGKYKGLVLIEIDGVKHGFKFGTRAMALFCDVIKINLSEVKSKLENNPSLETILTFYWCGAVAYARLMKQQEPSLDEVADWVDNFGQDKIETEIAKAMEFPNEPAPNLTGQQ